MLNVCGDWPGLTTSSTLFPSGVRNATLGRESKLVEAMRTLPGRTNLEAWATTDKASSAPTTLPSIVIAPWHMPHPPLSVWGLFFESAARFHSSTLRLQFRVAPMINLRMGAAILIEGLVSTEPVTICSVKYRFFRG